jgi:lysophospholipase L1-like esterase
MSDMPDTAPQFSPPPRGRLRRFLRIAVPALLLLLLIVSLVANVLLYREAVDGYRRLSEQQLDPYGLKHPNFSDPAPATSPSTRPIAVFYGDSRARMWTEPKVPGLTFINRGIGAQTTEQVRGRMDEHLLALSPRVVILQVGVNDLKAIGVLPHLHQHIVIECRRNIHEIINRAEASGAIVVVTTIFPSGEVPMTRRPVWSPQIETAIEEINADLRMLGSERVIVFDAWKLLERNGRVREELSADTLHLNARGYEVLNEKLQVVLTKAVEGK